MKRAFLSAASAVAIAMFTAASPASANTLYFQINPNFDTSGSRQVFIFGAPNTTGSVIGANGFNEVFDLGTAGFVTITIPVANELANNLTETKGFRVESAGAVSGYLLNRRTASTDMTYLIDSTSLGTDHVVAGYQNIRPDQMSAQATQDNTVVTFTPAGGGAPVQVTLNAGQTYMFSASRQLTGSRVTSDKPIAVFSGNNCANVPSNNTACDHLLEQIPSVDLLSTTYLLAKTPRTGTEGNVVRVVATADNTEVRFNGDLVATLNAGEFHEGRVPAGLEIKASQKVLVAQYLIGTTQAGAVTDPAMVIIPGQEQWLDSYVFAAPSGSANFPTDFVSIIMSTADIGSLLINGALADAGAFTTLGSTTFSFGDFDVSGIDGPFGISAASPFLLLLSGFDNADSYFTYGGARFSPGASPPPEENPPPADAVDVFWDGSAPGNANNDAVDGGDGTLTATSPNLTVDNGVTNNSLPVDPANIIFSATPGVVTVDDVNGPVQISGLEFIVDGYRITGDALTLQGTTATISVGDGTDAGAAFSAIIESQLMGTAALAKTGLGTLILTAANSYSGGTTVSAGTLVGNTGTFGTGAITANATLVFNQLEDGIFGNGIGGTGSLIKRGPAALTIEGMNSFSGGTTVETGRLVVNGDLGQSIVTVNSGARLTGDGVVGGVVALAGGTVAPGQSIGSLDVMGNYGQRAGSVYEVELNSAGQSDSIVATGTATIDPGAIINVVKLDASPLVLGTRYTVLTAAGGVTGTYALVGATRVSRFINVVAAYDPLNVYLDVAQTSSFASTGATPNQIAAAGGADNPGNGALYTAIAYLPDDASARAAFDQISGEIHASARGAAFEDSRFVREAVVNRMLSERVAGKGLWIHGFGAWGNFDGDGNAEEVERNIGGFFIGGEMVNDGGLTAGILAGYSAADIKVDARNSSADTSDFHLAAYGGFSAIGFEGRLGIANMWRDVKARRSVSFPGFTDSLTSNYDLSVFQIFGDAGYKIDVGALGLEPFFALAYVNVGASNFAETGGPAALTARNNGSSDYWLTTLGSRAYFGLPVGSGNLGVSATLGWRHASGDTRTTPIGMAFGSGGAFDIAGAPIAKDAAVLGLAISGKVAQNAEIDFGYSGQAGSGLSDHGIRASFSYRF